MKRLFIVVEGQTEQEFVNSILMPYFRGLSIYDIRPILIRTSRQGRGGLVNYQHFLNTIEGLLKNSNKSDFIVSTFVDFFRIPNNFPKYSESMAQSTDLLKVGCLENALKQTVEDRRFIPYIQLHEFEALLFSDNRGFEKYFNEEQQEGINEIMSQYDNPEDINSSPDGAPSKRLLRITGNDYDKVITGNLIALEVGIDTIRNKCPRFKKWTDILVEICTN